MALGLSWAPLVASWAPLRGVLGPPEAAGARSLGSRRGYWDLLGDFEIEGTESRYLETTLGRLWGRLGAVLGSPWTPLGSPGPPLGHLGVLVEPLRALLRPPGAFLGPS